jgi:Fe-S-cluster-containing hydrogenase component 2
MASIQLDKDPHFRKAEVDYSLCDLCSACVKICPTEAFKIEDKKFIYSVERCYGCGICPSYCHVSALKMIDTKPTPIETLKEMLLLNIEAIEFHFGENFQMLEKIWGDVVRVCHGKPLLLSFSIGSGLLSNEQIKNAANLCYKLAGKDIILQCDGTPMSGGFDKKSKTGYKKDNPSLQVAKIIEEEKLPVYLQISGGTNQNSYTMANEAGININGVAIGSYARKLLMPYLNDLNDEKKFESAVNIAKSLVDSVGVKV